MKNVSAATQIFTSGAYLANRPTYTLVYDSALNANPVNGMITVKLQTPFVRTAGDNLQILVVSMIFTNENCCQKRSTLRMETTP
jgi:hypothetical protein